MKKWPLVLFSGLTAVTMSFSGCETPGQGAKYGAITGAGIGAIAGGDIRSAAIGAGAGAAAGALIGAANEDRYYRGRRYAYYY